MKKICLALITYFILFSLVSCQPQAEKLIVKEKFLLDTLVTIKAFGKDENKVKKAINLAFIRMSGIEKRLNFYDSGSELSKLNRKGNIKASRDLLNILKISKKISHQTGGAFDVTIGSITRLWRFGENPKVPGKRELAKILPLAGNRGIVINEKKGTVALKSSQIDLGGILKGYAVDEGAKVLTSQGIKAALITTISSTKLIGGKEEKPWKIGIESPRPQKKLKLIGVLGLKNKSLSTSGDYQLFFFKKGKRYHHLLDPKTGNPAYGLMSVTVITPKSAAEADALSTGLFVLGPKKGMEFVEKTPHLEAIFVTSKGDVLLSRGLQGKVEDFRKKIPYIP